MYRQLPTNLIRSKSVVRGSENQQTLQMQLLFVKIATLAVMFHMAFGCVWHHGLVGSHVCLKDAVGSSCCDHHDEVHMHDPGNSRLAHREHAELPYDATPLAGCDDLNHQDAHFCCHDDSCTYSQVVDFDCEAITKLTEYLGGALNRAVKTVSVSPVDTWQLPPVCQHSAPGLRAHLYLCVQIL